MILFFLPNATVIVGMFSLSDSLTILSELSLTGILALCWYPNKLYYCSSLPKSIQNIQYFYRSNCFRFSNSLLKVTATFSKYNGKIAKKSVSSKKIGFKQVLNSAFKNGRKKNTESGKI